MPGCNKGHRGYTVLIYFSSLEIGGEDGIIKATVHNPAVSSKLINEIAAWKEEDSTMEDVVTRLRARTVPRGYKYHTWIQGTSFYC